MAIGNLPWRSSVTLPNRPTAGWGYATTVFFAVNLVVGFVVVNQRRATRLTEGAAASKEPLMSSETVESVAGEQPHVPVICEWSHSSWHEHTITPN